MKAWVWAAAVLLTLSGAVMAEEPASAPDTPTAAATPDPYKNMSSLKLLEEFRAGKKDVVFRHLEGGNDFLLLSKVKNVSGYYENEVLEKVLTKKNVKLNIPKWKGADRKVFGYSVKKENAEAYAVSCFLFAQERQKASHQALEADYTLMNIQPDLALTHLGFRITAAYLEHKAIASEANGLRDALQFYQSGVAMYAENNRNRTAHQDFPFAEKSLSEFLAASVSGGAVKK